MNTTSIYDSEDAPAEFVDSFLWWATADCQNQQYTIAVCGAPIKVFTEVLNSSREQVASECNAFWRTAKRAIQGAKGRCNWSPLVDTDAHHIGNCGTNFYFARKGDYWLLKDWPEPEKASFCKHAKEFPPMFLRVDDGVLVYVAGENAGGYSWGPLPVAPDREIEIKEMEDTNP